MNRKQFWKHVIFTLIGIVIAVIVFFSEKSDLWQLDAIKQNTINWTLLDSQWTVEDSDSFADDSGIIVRRPFFAKNIMEVLQQKDSNFILEQDNSLTLSFITNNQIVRVFKEKNRQITPLYSFGNNGKQYVGSESGRAVHFIPIPEAGKEDFYIIIELQPSFLSSNLLFQKILYGNKKISVPSFYFGTKTACLYSYIKKSIIQLIPIGVMLLMGLCVFYVYLNFLFTRKQNVREYRYWSMLAITCAVGFFMESYAALLMFNNSYMIMFISTVSIALTPRLFIGYMLENRPTFEEGKIARIFKILSPVNIIIACVFSMVKIIPFSLVRNLVEVVLFLFVLYLDYEIIYQSITMRTKLDSFDILMLVCSASLVADIVVDMAKTNREDLFMFGRLGMMVFFVISAMIVINEVYDREQLKTRSIMMEQYAFRDIITGSLNAIAIYRDCDKFFENSKQFFIIAVTLLNKKDEKDKEVKINRDVDLKELFTILCGVFPRKSIYRPSAYRFVILLKETPETDINSLIGASQRKIAEYNFKNAEEVLNITIQIERFTEEDGSNFEDLYLKVLNSEPI